MVMVIWLVPAYAFPTELKVLEKRYPFFVLKSTNLGQVNIGSTGDLFGEKRDVPIGHFQLKDKFRDQFDCQVTEIFSGQTRQKILWARFAPKITVPESRNMTQFLRLDGHTLHFMPIGSSQNVFLLKKPIALDSLQTADVAAMKALLFKVEAHKPEFRANFLSIQSIQRYSLDKVIDFTSNQKMVLGTANRKMAMLYVENRVLKWISISTESLLKYKNKLYIYILMERR